MSAVRKRENLDLALGCHPEPGPAILAGTGVRDLLLSSASMSRSYYVYILASRSRSLYTGVTNDLSRRLIEHRRGLVPGFTSKYRVFRLVHFEVFGDIRDAIAREKEIKGWRREKKVRLIQFHNRAWADLAVASAVLPLTRRNG